jgi:hypothetical protein
MMQSDENPEVQEAGASKASTVDYISGAKIVEGITTSVTDFTENLSKGITNVDNVMQSFVNQMGQGKGLAEEIRREYAGAAEEIIKLGGTQKEAAEVQTKTLDVLGRNVILSKEQSTELFAASKISGVAIEKLEKGFIDAGKSIKDISKEMLQVREVANNMGVNAKAVSALVVQNLDKLNRYGFQNGVEGLAKMAASSQALGIDMTQTLNLADDLMSPERSMEVAAMFQRMGASSAALTNPLKLIDLSMNNTEKLQEELGDYFKTFAKFDEKTGQFGIAKSERLKIKELSQSLGITREQIEKMALASADLDRKLSKISFAGFNVDEETKQMVANMAIMGEGGEYVIQTKEVDKDGKPTGELIQQSIQDFLTSTKGDKDAIKEALGTTEEATTRPIEQIAEEQLSYSQKIDANIKLLVEQPGLTAGASKAGKQLLEGTYEATKAVNEPFQKRLDSDSKIAKELDKFGVKLEEGITTLKEGGGYQDLLDAFKNQGAEFGKTVVTELTAGGIEVLAKLGDLTGLSELFQELELTKDVKEILEKIKTENGDFSDEAKKYFDDLLKEIEKKEEESEPGAGKIEEEAPPSGKIEEKAPPSGKIDEKAPPSGKIEESDEEKAKETIDKIGKKTGEFYEELKSTILNFFKEISTDKIDVKELNVLGGIKGTSENITPAEEKSNEFKLEVGPALAEVGGTEGLNIEDFIPLNELIGSNLKKPVPTPTTEIEPIVTEESGLLNELKVGTPKEGEGITKPIGAEIPKVIPTPTPIPTAENTKVEKIEGELSSIEQLKVGSSEIQTLNVQNLNIGTALNDIVTALNSIPEKQEQVSVLVDEIGKQQKNVEQVTTQPETQNIEPEAAIAELPEAVPTINVEETLPEITEELPELPKGETKGGFLDKILPKGQTIEAEKEPSAYEGYKKLLEEISGSEIVGQGEEAFFLTPEMKAQAKKDSEFIGPEIPETPLKNIQPTPTLNKTEEKPIGTEMSPDEFNMRVEMMLGKADFKKYKETQPELYDKINREATFTPLQGEKFELPELTKEQESIMMEGFIPSKQNQSLEEKFYDMKATEGSREIKKFEEEKLKAARLEGKDTMSEEDLDTLKSMKARRNDYEDKSLAIDYGEVESFNKKIEPIGLDVKPKLAPIKPTLASLPIPEKEEKQPLGKRLKEGIGEIKEKIKGKKEEEKPIAAVPETQEEYIIRDKEGKELARSIDRETAEKKAGTSEGITVSKETRAITPSAPEIPAVGVEKAAAEAEEKTPFGERIKESFGNIVEKGKEKFQEVKENLKDRKIEPIIPETPAVGVERVTSEKIEPTEITPKSGYLKMLEENDEKAVPFLTSKSGRPVNLDKTEADKIDIKSIEESAPKEKDTRSALEKISLTAAEDEGFDGGIIEPVEPTGIKPVEPEETEIQTALREAREKQLSYLEELRQKEQIETPSRGIERFAGKIGGIGEKLFGPVPKEIEPTLSEAIEEIPADEYGTIEEPTEFEEITPIEAIEETAPAIPEPAQPSFGQIEDLSGQRSFGEPQAQQGENTQNINIKATIEIVGNGEFAKLLDPRKFQETIEGVITKSIGNPQFAQKISTGTQRANMGMIDK